jgi:hypothetical protein
VGIGQTTFGTSAVKVLAIGNGTAPTTSPADAYQLWSADVSGDGDAGLFIRTESGTVHQFGTDVDFGGDVTATSFASNASTTPSVDFYDSDASAGDVNARIYATATDTGDGTEDVDVIFQQQVAGAITTFAKADADGNLELGGSAQPVEIKGKFILSTVEVTCADATDTCSYNANIYQHWLTAGTDTTDDTLTLSAGVEGQEVNFIHCGGTDDVVIDASTGTDTTLSSGESVTYIYRSSNTTWYIK